MREILFRGFHVDKEGKEFIEFNGCKIEGEWVFGAFGDFDNDPRATRAWITPISNEDGFNRTAPYWEDIEVIPETIGQFTGLLDKNGKQIFEGDVVNHEWSSTIQNAVMQVIFDRGAFFLNPIAGRTETHGEDIWKIHAHVRDENIDVYSEVIGTIFDVKEEEK